MPRPGDVFQERLYCIRWIDTEGKRRYAAPIPPTSHAKRKCYRCCANALPSGNAKGLFHLRLSRRMATKRKSQFGRVAGPTGIIYSRQGSCWCMDCSSKKVQNFDRQAKSCGSLLLELRLVELEFEALRWTPQIARSGGIGAFVQTFYNQAINPLFNWGTRPLAGFRDFVLF